MRVTGGDAVVTWRGFLRFFLAIVPGDLCFLPRALGLTRRLGCGRVPVVAGRRRGIVGFVRFVVREGGGRVRAKGLLLEEGGRSRREEGRGGGIVILDHHERLVGGLALRRRRRCEGEGLRVLLCLR